MSAVNIKSDLRMNVTINLENKTNSTAPKVEETKKN